MTPNRTRLGSVVALGIHMETVIDARTATAMVMLTGAVMAIATDRDTDMDTRYNLNLG